MQLCTIIKNLVTKALKYSYVDQDRIKAVCNTTYVFLVMSLYSHDIFMYSQQ